MSVIIKPAITEKNTTAAEKFNRYAFIVDRKANKVQIKKEVEKTYGVKVESVNTMNYGRDKKMRYTKVGLIVGTTNAYKKAVVTLAKGDVIDFYSNI
jgi:large subunit ribosomal protein L23